MNESRCEQRSDTTVRTRRTFHGLIAGAAGAQLFLPSNASAQDARVTGHRSAELRADARAPGGRLLFGACSASERISRRCASRC